jgi:hypothetical protein
VKVTDYDNGRFRSGPKFFPQLGEFTDETTMEFVLEWIHTAVDSAYTRDREYRVFSM